MRVTTSEYSTILNEHGGKPMKDGGKGGKGQMGRGQGKKQAAEDIKAKKNHAVCRGAKRGSVDGKHDAVLVRDSSPIDEEAADEGLLSLVQAGTCRRETLTQVFKNSPAVSVIPSSHHERNVNLPWSV